VPRKVVGRRVGEEVRVHHVAYNEFRLSDELNSNSDSEITKSEMESLNGSEGMEYGCMFGRSEGRGKVLVKSSKRAGRRNYLGVRTGECR